MRLGWLEHRRRLFSVWRVWPWTAGWGVVCSPQEVAAVRRLVPKDFAIVTPGIRLPDAIPDDQRRVLTPRAALAAGATYLVVGRPITAATDPAAAAQRIVEDLAAL